MDTSNIYDGYAQHERTLKEKENEVIAKKRLVKLIKDYIAAGEKFNSVLLPEREKKAIEAARLIKLEWYQEEVRALERLQQEFETMYKEVQECLVDGHATI
ncbi:uncharacterized protein LOC119075411 isoform X2 [Bradysia coprophila]|uniref:uncharacterized protein LOC119075411 isoform X2 n=1 Tax=Bradysia coprophila TaxID=38358 RepID=UPI00187D705E|nr:uncharacterized protein LOC119075411 isoform X2 [Bradysia coprophila]